MPEAHITSVSNRLGALALTLSDRIRSATEGATGLAGALPAALISLREWADGCSIEMLAEVMGVSHSRAVRVVDRLEEAGLARRQSDSSDGRRALVWLEPAGAALADRALEVREEILTGLLTNLSADDVRRLGRLLARLLNATTDGPRTARQTCRLCDAHACGHFEGDCPVTNAAEDMDRA